MSACNDVWQVLASKTTEISNGQDILQNEPNIIKVIVLLLFIDFQETVNSINNIFMKYNFFSLQRSLISDNVISLKYQSISICRVHDLICNIAKYFFFYACLSLSLSAIMPKSFHKSISKVVYQVYEGSAQYVLVILQPRNQNFPSDMSFCHSRGRFSMH